MLWQFADGFLRGYQKVVCLGWMHSFYSQSAIHCMLALCGHRPCFSCKFDFFVFDFYILKFGIVIWYTQRQLTQLAIFQDNLDLMLPQILFYFGSFSNRSLSTLNPISPLCNWVSQKFIPYALVFILGLHLWTYSSTLHILQMLGSPSTLLRMCFSWAQLIRNPWIQSCQRAFDKCVQINWEEFRFFQWEDRIWK